MPLSDPRPGESLGFSAYPATSDEGTLGDPEQIIWSSIRHLCSRGVAEEVAIYVHDVTKVRDIRAIARNLKLYINQAHEFYEAAQVAKPNTAPLIYYYSFLHLAKALCEFRHPGFHKKPEYYRHGISWRPNKDYLVNLEKEVVSLTTRGVWHVLWESLTRTACAAPNPTRLRIKDLFLYCPEISVETGKAFKSASQLVKLVEPDILYDEAAREAWIRFSVERQELKYYRLTAPGFINSLSTPRSSYTEIRSPKTELRSFETTVPVKKARNVNILEPIFNDVVGMNLFCHFEREIRIQYSIPIQNHLPIRMPQLMVLYTILFWLGSLVRYDPHSVNELMESPNWRLIDGFMSQSRLWLLEQFEWSLYQQETTLWKAR